MFFTEGVFRTKKDFLFAVQNGVNPVMVYDAGPTPNVPALRRHDLVLAKREFGTKAITVHGPANVWPPRWKQDVIVRCSYVYRIPASE